MRRVLVPIIAFLGASASLVSAQGTPKRPAWEEPYISMEAPLVALTHVHVINGMGGAPLRDQTILIENGKIRSIGGSEQTSLPSGAKVLDLSGSTAIPGLVGMHDHLFYPSGGTEGVAMYNELGFSAPRLYLACGVTSLRTTGSIEPYTDLGLKQLMDEGNLIGPKIHVTGPYLEGAGAFTPQMHILAGPDDARKTVDFWVNQGVTSFKAYMHITRAELSAAIEEAHKHGIKVTGHLCSVGFREAAALGIDDLEHGLLVDTEFDPGKTPDVCPSQRVTAATLDKIDIEGEAVQQTIQDLVRHHVAVTSTLPIFETFVPNRPPISQRVLDSLAPETRVAYLTRRAIIGEEKESPWPVIFKKEMQFERDFVKAGGLLLAGNDPTGYGGDLPGFGDLRGVELLVEAGFNPAEAIQIASANGAKYLGELDRIGTLEPGKQADVVVVKGDLAGTIADIQNVTLVFKDGVGYDSTKLIDSVRGQVGLH